METSEIYFRLLDRVVDRENFLEKEMLDSDVRHLEVQGQFFDKLAVLGAGSLAVGISFMVAGFDHPVVQTALHTHLTGMKFALGLLLLSLAGCIVHNFLISDIVKLLSSQIEQLYKSAVIYSQFRSNRPYNVKLRDYPDELAKFKVHEDGANGFRRRKETTLSIASWVGRVALSALLAGYGLGLIQVVRILETLPISQPSSMPANSHENAPPVVAMPLNVAPPNIGKDPKRPTS